MTSPRHNASALLSNATGLTLLRITGEDATRFLNAQATAAFTERDDGLVPAAITNPKGRVLVTFHAWRTDDAWLLALPASEAPWLRDYLARFLFRSRVAIAGAPDIHLVGLYGEAAAATLTAVGLPVPEPRQTARAGGLAVIALAGERWLMSGPDMALADAIQALAAETEKADFTAWKRARLEAGEVEIRRETRGRFLPQMLGLVELGAVSFHKGCYPGQEIIARARRGNVKRGLTLLHCAEAPPAGATIELQGMRLEVLDSVAAEADGALVQAVAPRTKTGPTGLQYASR